MSDSRTAPAAGDRLAKVIARSGLCSRRDAEGWIKEGRVAVNGKIIRTPAFNVVDKDKIAVDGSPLAAKEGTRVWLYHKPAGLMVTEKDPEGRPTVFEKLQAEGLPRVVSIGRLDFNTEGLLLVTNDGGLKRVLELPATGWLRRYRVRAFGNVTQADLDKLKNGIEVDGVKYGQIEATLERDQGSNVWLLVGLREGKNREVKNVLAALGLQVNRLIRVSYGPFQLGDLPVGGVEAVKARVLRDQLGKRLAEQSGADLTSDPAVRVRPLRERETGRGSTTVEIGHERFRFADRADGERNEHVERPPRRDRPGRPEFNRPPRPAAKEAPSDARPRKVHFDDGRESAAFETKLYGKKPPRDAKPAGKGFGDKPKFGDKPRFGDKPKFGDKPRFGDKPKFGDRPKRTFGDKPAFADRPKREFGASPRPDPDRLRPPRPDGPRPGPAPRAGAADRPARSFSDRPRPPRDGAAPRPTGGERKPYVNRGAPAASGDRSERKPYAKRAVPAAGAAPARKPYGKRTTAAPGAVAGRGNRKDGVSRGPRPPGAPRKPGKPRPPRTRA